MNIDELLICYNSLPLFADHVIDYSEQYYAEHGVKRLHNHDFFDPKKVKDGDVVCVKTDFVESGQFYHTVFPLIESKFKLITTISSLPGPKGDGVEEMLNSDKIIAWYPCHVNPDYGYHEKVFPVPIGFTEKDRANGNQTILRNCRDNRIPFKDKEKSLFLPYHNLNTNVIRKNLVDSIMNSGVKISRQTDKLPIESCLNLMGKYKYIICLEGSGIDTHRAYECLLMDCVPIMKKTPLHRIFDDYNLPGVFVDSWDDIDENFIDSIDESKFSFSNIDSFLLAKTHGNKIRT